MRRNRPRHGKGERKMFDIEKNKTDRKGFEDGKWFDFESGARVKIASTRSTKALELYTKLAREKTPEDMKNEKTMEDIVLKVYSEAVVTDWSGFFRGGKSMPCTAENVLYVLKNSLEFYQFVTAKTNDIKSFRQEKTETERKNLKAS